MLLAVPQALSLFLVSNLVLTDLRNIIIIFGHTNRAVLFTNILLTTVT